jgi:hypothetical protein
MTSSSVASGDDDSMHTRSEDLDVISIFLRVLWVVWLGQLYLYLLMLSLSRKRILHVRLCICTHTCKLSLYLEIQKRIIKKCAVLTHAQGQGCVSPHGPPLTDQSLPFRR